MSPARFFLTRGSAVVWGTYFPSTGLYVLEGGQVQSGDPPEGVQWIDARPCEVCDGLTRLSDPTGAAVCSSCQ